MFAGAPLTPSPSTALVDVLILRVGQLGFRHFGGVDRSGGSLLVLNVAQATGGSLLRLCGPSDTAVECDCLFSEKSGPTGKESDPGGISNVL